MSRTGPSSGDHAPATRRHLPLILVRGFGGLSVEDEKRLTYQGFNVGTVYPHKRGENYIYEGLVLRFLKSDWQYQDATNVVGFHTKKVVPAPAIPKELKHLDAGFFSGHKIVIDPAMALHLKRNVPDPYKSLWIFRYYDLNERVFSLYGQALVRLIDFIQALLQEETGKEAPRVNIIAHSMGGLIVREAIQQVYPAQDRHAADYINKIVTLGTPHQGISFQILKNWIGLEAEEELERFFPGFQKKKAKRAAYVNLHKYFPLERLLTVVGTNHKSYGVRSSAWLNRLFSVSGEFGPNYNRSDGLVQQTFAQVPGAPRTFVHKCHGGEDSLVTSREAFEIATRFFFGNVHTRLWMKQAKVLRGKDRFGKSEFFFGVGIKPRGVDFELFHQSGEAENCYGPFHKTDLSDKNPSFNWAGDDRLIWEGWLNTANILHAGSGHRNIVLRLDFYVGERDLFGLGFSDNVVFRKQYYVRAVLQPSLRLYLYPDERFAAKGFEDSPEHEMETVPEGWRFSVKGTGFEGTFQIELENVPDIGPPQPFGKAE